MKYTREIYADAVTGLPLGQVKPPRNRIEFLDDEESAGTDIIIFSMWADGAISTHNATKQFRNVNLFETISEEDFVQNANWLGYFRAYDCLQAQTERRGTE